MFVHTRSSFNHQGSRKVLSAPAVRQIAFTFLHTLIFCCFRNVYGDIESFVLHNTSNERLTDDSHGRSLSVRVRKIDRVVLKKTRYRFAEISLKVTSSYSYLW